MIYFDTFDQNNDIPHSIQIFRTTTGGCQILYQTKTQIIQNVIQGISWCIQKGSQVKNITGIRESFPGRCNEHFCRKFPRCSSAETGLKVWMYLNSSQPQSPPGNVFPVPRTNSFLQWGLEACEGTASGYY